MVVTWNAGASTPGSVRTTNFIEEAVHPDDPPEILVFGFQELVDLEDKKITASSSADLIHEWVLIMQRACSGEARRRKAARKSI